MDIYHRSGGQMTLENAILGFLDRGPMTGYDLKTRCFDAAAGHLWTADQAQVYRTLEKLGKRELVRSKLVPQRGKPDRRLFTITPKGRAALGAWLHAAPQPSPLRDPLLMRLTLADTLADADILGMLASARRSYQERLEALRLEASTPPPSCAAPDSRSAALYEMTLAAAMSNARTAVDWIDDCIDRTRGGLPPAGVKPTNEGVA